MLLSLFISAALLASSQTAEAACPKYVDAANEAATNLQSQFFVNGAYGSQSVWIGAVDTVYLLQLYSLAGNSTYSGVINTVFNGQQDYLTNGQSYDDVQWVAIAYLQAGQQDEAKKYYDIASTAVDSTYCGGGLFWSGKRNYKNAITNELYMASSGYMYDVLKDQQYLDNLNNTWTWLRASKMRGDNGLFNDGLTNDGNCDNDNGTQWTYNQGTVLVGLGYLFKYTGDEQAVQDAWAIMDATINDLTLNGGLRESCETATQNTCNADQQSFKGITMYYMAWFLNITQRDNGSKYSDFIKSQADKVLTLAVGSKPGWYTNLWCAANAGGAQSTGSSQGSALGALVAAGQQNC